MRSFQRSDRNGQSGVATPKRDNYIELAVHPRYKYNIARYVMVIRNMAVQESPSERVMRIAALERRLLEPATAARAALQLEAIGDEAIPVLLQGLTAPSTEVRFYAAEALAYLDREEAAPLLLTAAKEIPAFRWHALTALAAMDHVAAYEALNQLLHEPSVETRYGAFAPCGRATPPTRSCAVSRSVRDSLTTLSIPQDRRWYTSRNGNDRRLFCSASTRSWSRRHFCSPARTS